MTLREQGRRKLKMIFLPLAAVILMLGSYLFGIYSYPRNIWPLGLLREIKYKSPLAVAVGFGNYDSAGRLSAFPNKTQVGCPPQTQDTAVLLAIGQSNAANHAEKKFTTQYPQQVFSYHAGKCTVASSPLLGATGEEGEFITPLADHLIKSGTYKSVVIVAFGVGGTPIARWQKDGDLNEMLVAIIGDLKKTYKITDVVWHQGESDFELKTSAKVYVHSFRSLMETLTGLGVNARVFISVSTKCGANEAWSPDNPTAAGQRMLVDNKTIFLGADTDALLKKADRREDDCHLGESGQVKAAAAYADAMKRR
jgi:hypothetical protein